MPSGYCDIFSDVSGSPGERFVTHTINGLIAWGLISIMMAITASNDLPALKPCDDNEYLRDKECLACSPTSSLVLLLFSALTFLAGAVYAYKTGSILHKVMQLKMFSSFFQCMQLTTLVSIAWPTITFAFTPFSLPLGDISCIVNVNANQSFVILL